MSNPLCSQEASDLAAESSPPAKLRDCFETLSQEDNLRSTSGLLRERTTHRLLHYKRLQEHAIGVEAAELHRAATVTKSISGIRPIELRAWYAEERLMVTEYVERSQTMFNHLWNGSSRLSVRRLATNESGEISARVGRWLQAYHRSTASVSHDNATYLRLIIEQANGKLNSIERAEPDYLPQQLRFSIRQYLARTNNSTNFSVSRPVCRIHGDFGLANILQKPDRELFVIDFADTRLGFAWEDVARYWHEVWSISTLSRRRRKLLVPGLDAVLHTYGESMAILDDPLFILIRCWNAICNILTAVFFSRRIGLSAGWASRRLANVNRRWLASIDWGNL